MCLCTSCAAVCRGRASRPPPRDRSTSESVRRRCQRQSKSSVKAFLVSRAYRPEQGLVVHGLVVHLITVVPSTLLVYPR